MAYLMDCDQQYVTKAEECGLPNIEAGVRRDQKAANGKGPMYEDRRALGIKQPQIPNPSVTHDAQRTRISCGDGSARALSNAPLM